MKWILPVTLFAVAVTAQEKCAAENIVVACIASETPKLEACAHDDYNCQCAAQQAISTCYNNCQDDPRKVQAEGQVQIYCANASIYAKDPSPAPTGSSSSGDDKPSKPTGTGTNAAKPTTTDGSDDDADADESGDEPSSAADLALNAGSMLLAVAGVMAVVV